MTRVKEQLYTLEEAKRELARQECEKRGHSFQVVLDDTGEPVEIKCQRCDRIWRSW